MFDLDVHELYVDQTCVITVTQLRLVAQRSHSFVKKHLLHFLLLGKLIFW